MSAWAVSVLVRAGQHGGFHADWLEIASRPCSWGYSCWQVRPRECSGCGCVASVAHGHSRRACHGSSTPDLSSASSRPCSGSDPRACLREPEWSTPRDSVSLWKVCTASRVDADSHVVCADDFCSALVVLDSSDIQLTLSRQRSLSDQRHASSRADRSRRSHPPMTSSFRIGAAIAGAFAAGGLIKWAFVHHERRLARDSAAVESAPLFSSVQALRDFVLGGGAPGGAGPRSAIVNLEAISAEPNGREVIVREEQIEETSEHYEFVPERVEETQEDTTESPSASSSSSSATTTTTRRHRKREAARWERSERTKIISEYASSREMHTLLLADKTSMETIAISRTSLIQAIENSEDIWTAEREWYISVNERSTPPLINASVNLNLTLSFSGASSASASHAAIPPPIPPRVLGRRHRERVLHAGEQIYAYGEARLEENAGEGQIAAEMSLQPTILRSGTRAAYLESQSERTRESRLLGWILGGVGALGVLAATLIPSPPGVDVTIARRR
jgi:hypothetical protein